MLIIAGWFIGGYSKFHSDWYTVGTLYKIKSKKVKYERGDIKRPQVMDVSRWNRLWLYFAYENIITSKIFTKCSKKK